MFSVVTVRYTCMTNITCHILRVSTDEALERVATSGFLCSDLERSHNNSVRLDTFCPSFRPFCEFDDTLALSVSQHSAIDKTIYWIFLRYMYL